MCCDAVRHPQLQTHGDDNPDTKFSRKAREDGVGKRYLSNGSFDLFFRGVSKRVQQVVEGLEQIPPQVGVGAKWSQSLNVVLKPLLRFGA